MYTCKLIHFIRFVFRTKILLEKKNNDYNNSNVNVQRISNLSDQDDSKTQDDLSVHDGDFIIYSDYKFTMI